MSGVHVSAHSISAGGSVGDINSHNIIAGGDIYLGDPKKQTIELSKAVSDIDFSEHQSRAFDRYTEGTLLWILEEPNFVVWLEDGGILWCPGKPGAGKTVFTSFIINHLQKEAKISPKPVVCYMYCRYDAIRSTLQLFSAILKQLILRSPSTNLTRIQWATDQGERLTLPDVLSISQESLTQIPNVFILVDALDECIDERTRYQILRHLQSFTSVHILITSRPLPSIESAIGEDALRLTICAHDEDIAAYLRARVDLSPRLRKLITEDLRAHVAAQVIEKADGSFLLAHLHIESLSRQALTKSHLLRTLNTLPKDATQSYNATLLRIRNSAASGNVLEKELAFQTMSWVLHSWRPLRVEELRYALAMTVGLSEMEGEGEGENLTMASEDDLMDEETIIDSCMGLVVVDRYSWPHEFAVVRFLHYTVKEFLEQTAPTTPDFLSAIQIATYTMKVISLPNISTTPPNYPLIEYAAEAWGRLVRQHSHQHSLPNEVVELALAQLREPAILDVMSSTDFDLERDMKLTPGHKPWLDITPLHLVAVFDLVGIYHTLLSQLDPVSMEKMINAKDNYDQTPLLCAAKVGNGKIAKELLGHPNLEDVNPRDKIHRRTPISWAAGNGHVEVFKILLTHPGVEVDARDKRGFTPLLRAVTNRRPNLEIVKLLLILPSVDVNAKDFTWGRAPLSWVAEHRHLDLVRELLGHPQIDVNTQDENDDTPLSYAAKNGNAEIVNLLLNHPSVELETRDKKEGQTPFSWAARNGKLEAVKVFIDHCERGGGVDLNSRDLKYGLSPILWAALLRPTTSLVGLGEMLSVVGFLVGCRGVEVPGRRRSLITPVENRSQVLIAPPASPLTATAS